MLNFLDRNCSKCNGKLADEWKLDLPRFRELVCLNCGNRFWEKMQKQRKAVRKDIQQCFAEDQNRRISKGHSPRQKKRRNLTKTFRIGISPIWAET